MADSKPLKKTDAGKGSDGAPQDPRESLRRANMAYAALGRGEQVPTEARMPDNGGPPIAKSRPEGLPAGSALPQPGLIYSQPGRPPAAVVRQVMAKQPGDDIRVVHQGSAFERLKLGQQRLGKNAGAAGSSGVDVLSAVATPKALGQKVLSEIQITSNMSYVSTLVASLASYYRSTPQETAQELRRLETLTSEDLHRTMKCYEFANQQVLAVTDEKHTQNVARESSKEIRKFYGDNGTSEDVIEAERAATMAAQNPAPRPKSKGR